MSQTENKLKPRQASAIRALLSEPSVKAAAKRASISQATIHRWLADPLFSQTLRDARGAMLESVLTVLQNASTTALETLREVMEDSEAHPSARVKAALGVIGMTLKAKELLETEERLRAVEEQLKEMGKR